MGADWIAFSFSEIVAMSWRAAVLIVMIFAAQIVVGRWLGPAWRYRLWLLVLIRLMLPTSIESSLSIFNYLRPDGYFHLNGLRLVWVGPVPASTAHKPIVVAVPHRTRQLDPSFGTLAATAERDLMQAGIRTPVIVTPARPRWHRFFGPVRGCWARRHSEAGLSGAAAGSQPGSPGYTLRPTSTCSGWFANARRR